MNTLIFGIDHGNGNMKTAHTVFPCGYKMQDTEPSALYTKDIIGYNGKYYSLTSDRLPYQVDKTKTDDCFILTLFAIAKECVCRVSEGNPDFSFKKDFSGVVGKDMILSIGLPPAHFEEKWKSFKKYFENKMMHGVSFTYNGKPFSLYLKDVHVYPQDWAAVITFRSELINKYSTVYCIDIGDGTVDLLALVDGTPDKKVMVSRELGISHLREQIIDDVINDMGITLDNRAITDVLTGKETVLDGKIVNRIKATAEDFAGQIVNQLHNKVPDFRIAPTVFCGGGAMLLKPFFDKSTQFGVREYIPEIQANAIGYETLAKGLVENGA